MLRYGRGSEWWWRLVRFYPGAQPLLPIQQRRHIRATNQHQPTLAISNEVSNLVTSTIDSSRLIEQIEGIVTSSVSKLKVDLEQHIQTAVAAGIAEFMQRQSKTHHHPNPLLANARYAPLAFQQAIEAPASPTPPVAQTSSSHLLSACQYQQEPSGLDIEDLYADAIPMEIDSSAFDLPRQLLQRLFPDKPGVDFLSKYQRDIATQSLIRERSFIGVLPTGGGKSVTFLLPALTEEKGITLVAVPNKALLAQMLDMTNAKGIPACQWLSGNRDIGNSRVVFLAIESITSLGFKE